MTVSPFSSSAFTSAFASSNILTFSKRPEDTAHINGVVPNYKSNEWKGNTSSLTLTLIVGNDNKKCKTSGFFDEAAQCKGVLSSSSKTL